MNKKQIQAAREVTGEIGKHYAKAHRAMEAEVQALDDAALRDLEKVIRGFSETNCWWAEYRAKGLILDVIKVDWWRREKEKLKAAEEATESR